MTRGALLTGIFLVTSAGLFSQTIDGQITNSATGAALPGVNVRIFGAAGGPSGGYALTSDGQGRFHLENVKPGAYRALYSARGFQPATEPGGLPPAFVVPATGEPVRLEIKLQPFATISGRILDSDGKPVPNASLWLIHQERWCAPPDCHADRREERSRDNGGFTVKDLRPGPWLVSAAAKGLAQTYFPGVIDPRLAQAIVVQPGGEAWNTNIKLVAAPVHHIRGRVLDPDENPLPKASVTLEKVVGPSSTAQTKADGTFDFEAVDGEWDLSAAAEKMKGGRTVQLKDRDADGIELRLSAPFTLRGSVVMEAPDGVTPPEPPSIDMGLEGPGGFLVIRTDGEALTVQDVYPGSYRVQFLTDSPVPYYLDSIRLGNAEAAGAVSILSADLPLTIRFKLGGGSVRGSVEGCGSRPVFLVPQEAALRSRGFIRIAKCDDNGRFEIPAVRPGDYSGVVLAKAPQSLAELALDRVVAQGSAITVRANESTSVELRVSNK